MIVEKTLLPSHREMLVSSSGIGEDVIAARGYFSATTRADLKRIGFPVSQQIAPTLVVPVWGVGGEIRHYQHRPDTPRMRSGKIVKYETRAGTSMIVDVHPNIRGQIRDPAIPLFITEGIKKADAAITGGMCCIGLLGVYNWRGTNEHGGKAALPDWEYIPLNERLVYLCFDSDAMEKKEVHAALRRLKAFLELRGAKVWVIYLPSGDGNKTGLDDYLAAGHTRADLLTLTAQDLRPLPQNEEDAFPYRQTPGGLVLVREGRDGREYIPLTNFEARIVEEVAEDDGAEVVRAFKIEAARKGATWSFRVPSDGFFAVRRWAIQNIGASAIVSPGQGCEAHAAAAIQSLSGDIPQAKVYKHTGWRELDEGVHAYLSAGSLPGDADLGAVSVQLAPPLDRFCLPEPPEVEECVRAVRASLRMLKLAPPALAIPVYAAIWRAAISSADFAVFLMGQSGVFKSELAALAQQHFGASMDARNLLASWEATENFLEGLAFAAKDGLLVIDDYAPRGGQQEQARLAGKADRVLRAQGNNSARGRLRADLSTRPPRPPRGLILSTGEDIPPGHSLRARNLILEVAQGDIDVERLTLCQRDAAAGDYALAMSGFLNWVAPQYEMLQERRRERVKELRAQVREQGGGHARTPEIVANLGVGLEFFLEFAEAIGALSMQQKNAWLGRSWQELLRVAAQQGQHQAASEPVQRYLELLQSALASGEAHAASPNGDEPDDPYAWGWRSHLVGAGEYERQEWRPQGKRIGWVDGTDLYLEPQAAYQIARRLGEGSEGIAIGQRTLHRLLKERGLLLSYEKNRGAVARREVEGKRLDVIHLRAATLSNEVTAQTAIADHADEEEADLQGEEVSRGQNAGTVTPPPSPGNCPPEPPAAPPADCVDSTNGQKGQFGQLSERSKELPDVPAWDKADRKEWRP